MAYWDTHMHSNFSGDSNSTPESMVQASIQKGLAGICFTDHLDYSYPNDPSLFLLDLPSYSQAIHRLQAEYAGKIPVLFGIELGLQPQLAVTHRQLLQEYDFDFVIGSSHVVHGADPYYSSYYSGRTESAAYLEYFESILENIHACPAFDVYGHLDYVVRYGPHQNTFYAYETYQDIIDEILRQLVLLGKGLELNMAGFKYGLGHPNPCEDILKRYRALGGEILTLGADGHKPQDIGYSYPKLPSLLEACGFSYYTVFKKRRPEFIPV